MSDPKVVHLFLLRRLAEADRQNRDLVAITSKKEEVIQRLQKRSEELLQEITQLNTKVEGARSDNRRQVKELRDKLASKVCVHGVCVCVCVCVYVCVCVMHHSVSKHP